MKATKASLTEKSKKTKDYSVQERKQFKEEIKAMKPAIELLEKNKKEEIAKFNLLKKKCN